MKKTPQNSMCNFIICIFSGINFNTEDKIGLYIIFSELRKNTPENIPKIPKNTKIPNNTKNTNIPNNKKKNTK